jgi:tetratricopeptide (TPR) repeat protein
MAKQGGEHRMLFDVQGKRRSVVKVVYAVLALLMGASLFLVVGPFNLSELVGNSGGSSANEVFDDQAERIEKRLASAPGDEQLLLTLTRTRINAGNAQIEPVAEGEIPTVPPEAIDDFEAASESWAQYLQQADEPSATAAQLVAGTFFRLAESSTSVRGAEEYVARATKAQQIAADQSPSIGSLSTLAIYEYFNGEFDAAEKTTKQAAAKAPSKGEAKSIEKQLAAYRKNAEEFDQQRKQLAKAQKEFNKEQLKNPLGGALGGGALGE